MIKSLLTSVLALSLVLLSNTTYAQKERIIGFWEMEKVSAGEFNMTPVARWAKINADGSCQSGNGWLQNSNGNWTYDADNNTFSVSNPLTIKDEFGAFTVSFKDGKMIWEREEEGMAVQVTLRPISDLPMSPADYLQGLWDLAEITKEEQSILQDFDANDQHKLQIRWDRIFVNHSAAGKSTGYWHIHGHKPEITLLPHAEGQAVESWRVEVNENELIMTGISDSNRTIVRKYVRRNSF